MQLTDASAIPVLTGGAGMGSGMGAGALGGGAVGLCFEYDLQ